MATAAAVAFAAPQIPSAWAQDNAGSQSATGGKGANKVGQDRGSGGSAAQERSGREKSGNRGGENRAGAGLSSEQHSARGGSEKSRVTVGVRTGSSRTTVRERTRTRVGVRGGGDEDVFIRRRHARHVVVHEPSERTVIKRKRHIVYSEPERRTTLRIKHRQPSVAIRGETRTTIRTRSAHERGGTTVREGGVNVRSSRTVSRTQHSSSGGTVGVGGGSKLNGRSGNGSGGQRGSGGQGAGGQGAGGQRSGGGSGSQGSGSGSGGSGSQ